jgi:RND family efflux transporter MFP subunit
VALGAGLLALGMSGRDAPERRGTAERATEVAVVETVPREVIPRVAGYGTVAPARTWRAVPEVPGRIVEIHPELSRGGTVEEGALLARIAPESYEAAVAQAKANLAAAEAELGELGVTEETTRASLEIEREALALAERELDRQRRLAERGSVSQSVVDQQQRTVLQQRAKVQELENQLALLPTRREALRQQKRVAEANLEIAELDLAHTEIRAPFAARVATADAQIQQFVGTGTAIATLDGIATAEIDAQIPPARMAGFVRLAAGRRFEGAPADFASVAGALDLSASVSLAQGPGGARWPAEVRRISDTVDPETRSVGVIVAVEDPYGEIVPGRRPPLIKGMFTRVELRAPAVQGRILVPRSAVRDGRVMIADGEDRLAFAPVEIVFTMGDVAVLDGALEPGTRVVVSDPTPAIEGMLLAPEPSEAAARRISEAARPGGGPGGGEEAAPAGER